MSERLAPKTPFADLFWQCRAMNLPIVRLMTSPFSEAGSWHALSAGYAGLVGAVQSARTGRPFLITEHGIYARERDIELARANWIPDRKVTDPLEAAGPEPVALCASCGPGSSGGCRRSPTTRRCAS